MGREMHGVAGSSAPPCSHEGRRRSNLSAVGGDVLKLMSARPKPKAWKYPLYGQKTVDDHAKTTGATLLNGSGVGGQQST
jgi:hypothetical protein